MNNPRPLFARVVRAILGPFVARWHRSNFNRCSRALDEVWLQEWMADNPGLCPYCSYTAWVNTEKGQRLKIKPHDCIERSVGSVDFPTARLVRKP